MLVRRNDPQFFAMQRRSLDALRHEDSLGAFFSARTAVSSNSPKRSPPIAPDSTFPLSVSHLARKIHDSRNTEGLAMVQIR